MVKEFLFKLASTLKSTAYAHKKKLVFVAALAVVYKIVKKKSTKENVLWAVMYLFQLWTRISEFLPLPQYAEYRSMGQFTFVKLESIKELSRVIDINTLISRIKNKESLARRDLLYSVLSTLVLNIVLYNQKTIYKAIHKKYENDFIELGAETSWYNAMKEFEDEFVENLGTFREFVLSKLKEEFDQIEGTQLVGVDDVENIVRNFLETLMKPTVNINDRVLSRKSEIQQGEHYKIANNYFRTTREYIEEKPESKIVKVSKVLFWPVTSIFKGISYILKEPTVILTNERFDFHEFLYILPVKRMVSKVQWPSHISKYLYVMIVEEMINLLYSINFNILSSKNVELNLLVFMNRVNLYFKTKAKKDKIKFNDLIGIFYKIFSEEMNNQERKTEFYEREILHALRSAHNLNREKESLLTLHLRNKSLQEIYLNNEFEFIEKDFQAKFYHERDGLIIEPSQRKEAYGEKDEIEEFMQIQQKADHQEETTQGQLKMFRELIN